MLVVSPAIHGKSPAEGTVFSNSWKLLVSLSADPFPEVAEYAQIVVDYVLESLHETVLKTYVETIEQSVIENTNPSSQPQVTPAHRSDDRSQLSRTLTSSPAVESRFATTIKVLFRLPHLCVNTPGVVIPTTTQYPYTSYTQNSVSSIPYGTDKKPPTAIYKPKKKKIESFPWPVDFLIGQRSTFKNPK